MITVALFVGCLAILLLLVPFNESRGPTLGQMSRRNLQMLGIAMDNYAERETLLPPGTMVNAQGVTLHGWETVILPYVDAAPLYAQINLAEPWDAPGNLQHFRTPMGMFVDQRYTVRVDADGLPVSHYAANERLLRPGRSMRLKEITDGTTNTILAGTVAEDPRGWGTPYNLRDPGVGLNAGPRSFGCPEGTATLLLMADGSVRWISKPISRDVIKALGTPAGGERVELPP